MTDVLIPGPHRHCITSAASVDFAGEVCRWSPISDIGVVIGYGKLTFFGSRIMDDNEAFGHAKYLGLKRPKRKTR